MYRKKLRSYETKNVLRGLRCGGVEKTYTAAEWKKRMLKKSIVSNIMKICILSKIMEELVWRNIFSVTEPGLRLIRS